MADLEPASPRARIRVEPADALDRSADVLVLKYAQHLYGLDRAVLGRLGSSAPTRVRGASPRPSSAVAATAR